VFTACGLITPHSGLLRPCSSDVDLHNTGKGGCFVLCASENSFKHVDLTLEHNVTDGLGLSFQGLGDTYNRIAI
jgi:hypothetical protein